jgi:glycerate-2-kinase
MAAHAQRWGPFRDALVVAPHDVDIPGFESFPGEHPVPGAGSVAAGERLLALARATAPGDLFILLLSGGASALAESPAVPLADLTRATELLLRADATIEEINTVRRHLSLLKGGRLLEACRGEVVLLAISDVADRELATLGSGPMSADPTTYADALDILDERGLLDAMPPSVSRHLREGVEGRHAETLKPGAACLERVHAQVLADNDTALRAAGTTAAKLGYEVHILFDFLRGEARSRGRDLVSLARDAARAEGPPLAVLVGGETVVRVQGSGKGGRNQEVALAAVDELSALDAVLACFATDGIDGPTDAAGAIVDGTTRARAERLGLDAEAHLVENDAYPYFHALDDLISTGPTGTNVRDLAVLLVRRTA